jgi:hypothetical protein
MPKNRRSGTALEMNGIPVFQKAEITAESVKCGCIFAIIEGKCYPFMLIQYVADSFISLLQHTKNVFTPIYKISCYVWPRMDNNHPEKKRLLTVFQPNTEQKQFSN